jgi:hypothetical protein
MDRLRMWNRTLLTACLAVLLPIVAPTARAQQTADASGSDLPAKVAQQPAPGAAPSSAQPTTILPATHRFWDKENDWLFAGVAASRGLDYASTLNLRRRGINEALLTNSIVDNHPLFGGIEAMGTAASIGVSYLFHTTGHHRLERWTSAVHIGVATGGAVRNYLLKTPH